MHWLNRKRYLPSHAFGCWSYYIYIPSQQNLVIIFYYMKERNKKGRCYGSCCRVYKSHFRFCGTHGTEYDYEWQGHCIRHIHIKWRVSPVSYVALFHLLSYQIPRACDRLYHVALWPSSFLWQTCGCTGTFKLFGVYK